MRIFVIVALMLICTITTSAFCADDCKNCQGCEVNPTQKTESTQTKQQSAYVVKNEAEIQQRAQKLAEERKLKGEKPVSGQINDCRIMEQKPNGNPEGKIALDKLTPKCRFAYDYIQQSVYRYYAFFQKTPKDVEELIENNYLPFTLNKEEIAAVTNVLKLHGWNLSDYSVALYELTFEKKQKRSNYNKEEFEKRFPYFLFNCVFADRMEMYVRDVHYSFDPNFESMYSYIKAELGVNPKFWARVVDANSKPKHSVVFLKKDADLDEYNKVNKSVGSMLISFDEYVNFDYSFDGNPPERFGKVHSIFECLIF